MRRLAGTVCLVLLPLALPLAAQDRGQTLADIRQEMAILNTAVTELRRELSTTGAPGLAMPGGDFLSRVDTIEAALAQLTAQTEQLQIRVDRIVADGTNRLGDIDFRLTELEGGDLGQAGQVAPLGGAEPGATPPPLPAPAPGAPAAPGGGSMAVAEQSDFDRAREVLGQGDFRTAAEKFATYAETYPGGALTQEALFLRGEALEQLGETSAAARSWLDAFSSDMDGTRAPEALLKVGQALATLGQGPEACVTLAEVSLRYGGTPSASDAAMAAQALGCQ
ncbi:tol-pal system protein YbgF [Szabonella alba]|uniref:tol-pal system protein YbgF n=1 Tax=Szabonella alba TaxID=2804194 RepID=UPI003B58A33D